MTDGQLINIPDRVQAIYLWWKSWTCGRSNTLWTL